MCGIVGIFDSQGRTAIDRALLERMNDRQTHRGPDDGGLFVAPGVGLGQRRLSIIDVATGQQPLFNEDHTVVVVYNGEIYNFKELTDELIAAGHQFRTLSDTEVIVHAWEEWGEACVERFRGMFAFALWDQNQGVLFLARDRLGIKPLYYAALPSGLVLFGSELKSLLVHPDLPRVLDPLAIEDYFAYGYVPDPKSIYKHVAKLAPGHTLLVRRGGRPPVPKCYWDVDFSSKLAIDEAEACEELTARLREAVRIRLISEVPLGAFLSGGVDSSSVVAMMAGLSQDPVNTCSIGFNQAGYDESAFASKLAERYNTNHRLRHVDSDSFDLIDRLADIYDEPYADSSAIPTYRVCGLAREGVTVALSGDGGDEIFAGYRRYRWHHYEELVRSRVPDGVRGPLFGFLGRVYPKMDWAPKPLRAKSTLEGIARDSAASYFHSVSIMTEALRGKLFSASMRRDLQGYRAEEVLRHHMANAPTDHYLEQVQYADLKTYLPGDILTKVDRASMAHSLEVRVPMLDHKFVEWSARLPVDWKLRKREGKYILKKAMQPFVPDDILYREKMGFGVPIAAWFRGPLRERVKEALTGPSLEETGLFDMAVVSSMVDRHQSGRSDYQASLWALLMFQSFLQQVHGCPVSPTRDSAPEVVSAS